MENKREDVVMIKQRFMVRVELSKWIDEWLCEWEGLDQNIQLGVEIREGFKGLFLWLKLVFKKVYLWFDCCMSCVHLIILKHLLFIFKLNFISQSSNLINELILFFLLLKHISFWFKLLLLLLILKHSSFWSESLLTNTLSKRFKLSLLSSLNLWNRLLMLIDTWTRLSFLSLDYLSCSSLILTKSFWDILHS